MIVILIFAIIASFAFRRETTKRGYESANAIRFPLIAAAIALFLSFVITRLWAIALPRMGMNPEMVTWMTLATEVFFMGLFLAAIGKNWRAIKRLPDRTAR